MNSGVVRQYILGAILLVFAVYLSMNGSQWWILSLILGAVLLVLGNVNRKKNKRDDKS